MKITLRKKKISTEKESLYLDCFFPNRNPKRVKEYLKLYIFTKPKTFSEKEHNRTTLELAESVRAKKMLDLQYNHFGLQHVPESHLQSNFLTYFQEQINLRYEIGSKGNYDNWSSAFKYLKDYAGDNVPFGSIDAKWLEGFKLFLQTKAKTKSNTLLSQNSCYSYFNKVKACLKQAVKDRVIFYNPAIEVSGIPQDESRREFLTLEELRDVSKAECEISVLKDAFLFSSLTGLRWSDVNKLLWQEVQYSEKQGWFIRFQQQKTKGQETLPISQQARDLLGPESNKEDRVFKGLKYSAWHNLKLQQWVMRAGISKTITFHCARHTYATLQLTFGTDIYTVSKLLGHKELKTTQVYVKIIDQKKIDAANVIPNLNY